MIFEEINNSKLSIYAGTTKMYQGLEKKCFGGIRITLLKNLYFLSVLF